MWHHCAAYVQRSSRQSDHPSKLENLLKPLLQPCLGDIFKIQTFAKDTSSSWFNPTVLCVPKPRGSSRFKAASNCAAWCPSNMHTAKSQIYRPSSRKSQLLDEPTSRAIQSPCPSAVDRQTSDGGRPRTAQPLPLLSYRSGTNYKIVKSLWKCWKNLSITLTCCFLSGHFIVEGINPTSLAANLTPKENSPNASTRSTVCCRA